MKAQRYALLEMMLDRYQIDKNKIMNDLAHQAKKFTVSFIHSAESMDKPNWEKYHDQIWMLERDLWTLRTFC